MSRFHYAHTGRAGLAPRDPRQHGFTLLETAIGLVLGTALMAILGRAVIGTTHSIDYVIQDCVTVRDIQDAVNGIRDELRTSSTTVITPVYGFPNDTLTFQMSSGGVFGAEDQNGTFQAGWSLRYFVNGTDLTRQVRDNGGAVQSSGIIAQRIDTTLKGFSVTRNGSLYVVQVRIAKTFSDGKSYQKSMQSTVLVKS